MSLINQMLRDLDQRQTNAGGQTGTVHAVQPRRVPVGLVVLLTVVTCAVVAAGGWWMFRKGADAPTAQGAGDSGLGAGAQEFAANVAAPTEVGVRDPGSGTREFAAETTATTEEPALQPSPPFLRKQESIVTKMDSRLRGNDNCLLQRLLP